MKLACAEDFWAAVDIRNQDDCWVWKKGKTGRGYGFFRGHAAHRFSWQISHGPIPPSIGEERAYILHRCDNPPCVNPSHLFLGTPAMNMLDKVLKGRASRAGGRRKLKRD